MPKSRLPIGYVVQVDGSEVTLNLLDKHRGSLASHGYGVSVVTEVGSLISIEAGSNLLVVRVLSVSFAEPREVHRAARGKMYDAAEPLRHLQGVVVGKLIRQGGTLSFLSDSLSTPTLGAEAYPLVPEELSSVLGKVGDASKPIYLGDDLRGGGSLHIGLQDFISRHVAVLGSSGQGKSCFTAAILQQIVNLEDARVVIFDINGEYSDAFNSDKFDDDWIKVTQLGGDEANSIKIPYYALGRHGLHKLLMPSDKTQRPALNFALDNLNKVRWFPLHGGAGLVNDAQPVLFDDCRQQGAAEAQVRINTLRNNQATDANQWPHMKALSALVADSYSIGTNNRGGFERNAFNYNNVQPLVTRINRYIEDEMFCDVVDVQGGVPNGDRLRWSDESRALITRVFGGQRENWRVHIVDLKRVSQDLMPFILGALLEMYAYELFQRGQENKIPTLLVLEEAHHYLRPMGSGDEASTNALAYERLAKEGRKFGLALWLSTQRPSEVSPTVLSQCNNWISFRLSSEKDLATIQSASEWADRRDVKRIAGLPRQTAMVFGGSIQMPTLIRAPVADPLPRSEDANFDSWGG
ncbi:anti-phage-associated helicase HerA [Thalassospira sp. MCCC 1A03138]|uniref:anti-phage-associated helicase HerA n=1 Tax=Thalassospira sp. MCCC 1A03138 TaxID=1470576 RepID=UPI000A1FB7E3|nr:anti-phage-associated helicase HerA [Thalassospira sp. MCCC 1A03138]OSQ32237.1 ATPase [Thalassospira sp. MCCC 1A03138]